MQKLWYAQPAEKWEDGFPLGNGALGAMAGGNPVCDNIQLNEESLWSGLYRDRNNREAPKYLDEIRSLLFQGETARAEELTKFAMTGRPRNETVYQTLGTLCVETNHFTYSGYRRELDLSSAVASVEYDCGGVHYRREMFVSAPDRVFVLRFTADKPHSISMNSSLFRGGFLDYLRPAETDDPEATCMMGGNGISFCAYQKMWASGAPVEKISDFLSVRNADEVLIFLAASTSFRTSGYRVRARKTVERAMTFSYDHLLKRHADDYGTYFGRVRLELEHDKSLDELPTDERLKRFSSGSEDNGLTALYFDFGRYLLISSSREGTLPANLQGLWNKDLDPPWGSKYTININTEMNYWPAESCGLPECHMALFHFIKRMAEHGRETAHAMYHCRGIAAHHNTDIWGDTAPQDLYMPATYWVMSFPWLCTHIWQHYEYTGDVAFLREYWPILHDAALFFIDYLVKDPKGRLVVCPTVSPENSYIHPATGQVAHLSAGCTMDSQILRDLFHICIRSSKILQTGGELARKLETMLPLLPQTEVHSNGTIREWPEEYEEVEIGHRHISHLYGLFPSEQITPDGTPELAEAAKKTLERRLSHGGGHTGWSRAWIINFWARLQDGEKAWENIRLLFSRSTLPSLLDNHPPFQIDGNFGATAAIANMLLQCVEGKLLILPALPKEWSCGSISGIRAKGNLSLDIKWENGELTALNVSSSEEKTVVLRYQKSEQKFDLKVGKNAIPIDVFA